MTGVARRMKGFVRRMKACSALGEPACWQVPLLSLLPFTLPTNPPLLPCPPQEVAAKIGFPIMIKATAGGGGRGMRLANVSAA